MRVFAMFRRSSAFSVTSMRLKKPVRTKPVFEALESRQLLSASITGGVYNDVNVATTFKSTDPAVAGVRVYVDLGNHNAYKAGDPYGISDSLGEYAISGLGAGNYTLREVVPAGYRQTEPTNGTGHAVSLTSATHLTNVNFGNTQKVRVSGYVFSDSNNDGSQDHGEVVAGNVQIYLDANGNKHLDSGELKTTTSSSGYFVIGDLPPGKTYTVRIVPPAGEIQTDPTSNNGRVVTLQKGQTADNLLFGIRPSTVVIVDQSREAFGAGGTVSKHNENDNFGTYDTTATAASTAFSTLGDSGTANLTSSLTATTLTALGSLSTVQKHNTGEASESFTLTFTLSAATAFSTGYDVFGNDFSFVLQKLGNNGGNIINNNPTSNPNTKSYAFSKSGTLAAGTYEMAFSVFQSNSKLFGTNSFVMNFNI